MTASNTKECFTDCIGKTVLGCLFDAFPSNRSDLAAGTKTIVFDDGTGLTIARNGSFWPENRKDVETVVRRKGTEIGRQLATLMGVLELAGVFPKGGKP